VTDDEELLAAWRAGDRNAGDTLIARHIESIFRFFESKVNDDAEDLTQRTLLDCLESRAVVRSSNVRAYLFGIARNRLIDHLRSKYRAGEQVDVDAISIADIVSTAGTKLARNDDERRLHQALRTLPLDHQIALELAYWEGMTGPEIAAVLDVEASTIRSRLTRARDALRARLEELGAAREQIDTTLSRIIDND
jgi:RNA polymerase sigma factor (sigma-70 family)